MVGMPIYMNQEDNLERLVQRGVAVGVSKFSKSEDIYEAVMTVLSNKRYVKITNGRSLLQNATYKVSPSNLLEGLGVTTVCVPQLSIMHIVNFNEI